MAELRRTGHAVYELKYHFVFVPKYRRNVLKGSVAEKLKEVLKKVAEIYEFEIIEQEVKEDRVHIFLSMPPRYSPAEMVRIVKSISRNELYKEFPRLRKECWGYKLWADGYFVRAVGEKVVAEEIRRYIRYQRREREGKQLKLF